MDAELNIRSAGLNPDLANHCDGRVTHGLIFAIAESLRRSHGDRVASMHSHRIEVFDRADDDDIVFEVTHHLELVFFPAENRFFNQRFMHRGEIETASQNFEQLFAVVGHASAGAAERKAGTDNYWEADFARKLKTIFEVIDQRGFRNVEADLLHRVFKVKAVFGLLDGFNVGADQLHVVLFEHTAVGKLDGKIERSLPADGRKHSESSTRRKFTLHTNNFFQIFAGERLNVSAVGDLRIGHDGGRVRVGQHHFVSFGLERLAGLRAGIVELGGLPDDDGTRAEDQDF